MHLLNLWDNSLLNSRAIIDCMLIADRVAVRSTRRELNDERRSPSPCCSPLRSRRPRPTRTSRRSRRSQQHQQQQQHRTVPAKQTIPWRSHDRCACRCLAQAWPRSTRFISFAVRVALACKERREPKRLALGVLLPLRHVGVLQETHEPRRCLRCRLALVVR